VVVDFWAEWCGPCRQLGPALEAAVRERGGRIELAKVDVDSNRMLAQAFGIQGIPAVKAFRDGRIADEFTGAIPPAQIAKFLDRLLPSEADQLADAGDEDSLRAALASDPLHSGAALSLSRILIARGGDAEAQQEARELLAEYRRQIEEARGESRRILDEARKQGEAQRERTKREAREEGERIIQRAREEIERERDSALREVRREVASMVIQASEQVIGREVDRDEHERLISQALDDLEAEVAGSTSGDGSRTA